MAIVGMGQSPISRDAVGSARDLAASAIVCATRDAGLDRADIDGLVIARSPLQSATDLPLRIQADLALGDLSLLTSIDASGTSFVQAIQLAAMAVSSRLARNVACVFADTPISPKKSSQQAFSRAMPLTGIDGWEAGVGLFGATGAFALLAQGWMNRFGVGSRELFAYVQAARRWAALNPHALQRGDIDFEDYLASPFVVEPLRVVDCAYPVNGAIAVVISAPEAASDASRSVYVNAMSQGHSGGITPSGSTVSGLTGAAVAAEQIYARAGIEPRDVALFSAYDPFSFVGLMALEDYRLCPPGEAGAFVLSNQTAPGGRVPMNAGGGHLAGFYLQGATPVHEAIVQLRHEAGLRQVKADGPVLVTGVGGRYEYHAALILSRNAHL